MLAFSAVAGVVRDRLDERDAQRAAERDDLRRLEERNQVRAVTPEQT
ncbi:hypothetical protein GCM10010149_70570 [Nonomuraea roseoviolacea subsp. roseoviolacea]